MDIQYKRTNRESYMVIGSVGTPLAYEERMLKENEIAALLPFHTMVVNGQTQFWHDISGKQSLSDYLEQEVVSVELIDRIFTYLVLAFEELQKYLIGQQNVLLTPESIYLSRSDRFRLYLSYCPDCRGLSEPLMAEIMAFFIDSISQSEEDLTRFCYELYELALQEQTTIYELKERISREREKQGLIAEEIAELCQKIEPHRESEERPDGRDGPARERKGFRKRGDNDYTSYDAYDDDDDYDDEEGDPQESLLSKLSAKSGQLLSGIKSKKRREKKPSKDRSSKVNFEDFLVEPEPEELEKTELLFQANRACKGDLIYQGDLSEKNFSVEGEVFRIGHVPSGNEACLKGKAVSRHHAKIYKEGSKFYIEDLNSTNGTYINGEQLNYKEKLLLSPMDKILFGDVPYLFV